MRRLEERRRSRRTNASSDRHGEVLGVGGGASIEGLVCLCSSVAGLPVKESIRAVRGGDLLPSLFPPKREANQQAQGYSKGWMWIWKGSRHSMDKGYGRGAVAGGRTGAASHEESSKQRQAGHGSAGRDIYQLAICGFDLNMDSP